MNIYLVYVGLRDTGQASAFFDTELGEWLYTTLAGVFDMQALAEVALADLLREDNVLIGSIHEFPVNQYRLLGESV